MISDRKISGQRFAPTAADWNAFQDAALARRAGSSRESGDNTFKRDTAIGLVRNNYSGTLDRFAVVAIREPLITPADNQTEFERQLTFEAYLPNQEDVDASPQRIAVLLEPLEGDAIGAAQFGGLVQVRINIDDAAHRFARLDLGSSLLVSDESGDVEIVWQPGDGGPQWCVVDLSTRGAETPTGNQSLSVQSYNLGTGDVATGDSNIIEIGINYASGLRLDNPVLGDGIIRLECQPASLTHWGVVTTTTQSFEGRKTFNDLAWFQGSTDTPYGGIRVSPGIATFEGQLLNDDIAGQSASVVIRPASAASAAQQTVFGKSAGLNFGEATSSFRGYLGHIGLLGSTHYYGAGGCFIKLGMLNSQGFPTLTSLDVVRDVVNARDYCCMGGTDAGFAVRRTIPGSPALGTVVRRGADGTTVNGDTVLGGIITAIGGGGGVSGFTGTVP